MSALRIRVDVPADDVQRERIEHRVFQQLARGSLVENRVFGGWKPATLRVVEAPKARLAVAQRPQRRMAMLAMATAAGALAVALVVVLLSREGQRPPVDALALVQTPVGGTSRFTVANAVIDAGSDTSVSVERGDKGVVLKLAQGSVDCEVTRQSGQTFRVVAGEVEVEVVGTRFTVSRVGAGARVDVTRGKVRVSSRTEERMLTVGQSWTPATTPATTAVPAAAPVPDPVEATAAEEPDPGAVESDPQGEDSPVVATADEEPVSSDPLPREATERSRSKAGTTRRQAFAAAQALESTKPSRAASAYRKIANGQDAWAAVALYSLAELQTARNINAALRTIDELARRFPTSTNVEDAVWLRANALRDADRLTEARRVAAEYLRKYPDGTYAKPARRLLNSP